MNRIPDLTTADLQLSDALSKAALGQTTNLLTSAQVKAALHEYLREYAHETDRFPELVGKDHWELVMADYDPREPALFALALFTRSAIAVLCGSHDAGEVRSFVESDYPDDPSTVIVTAEQRFSHRAPVIEVPLPLGFLWLETN